MLISILRTLVPALWGSLIGFVLSTVPALEPLREQLLAYAEVLVPIIAAVIVAAWYAFWRWLEPRLPAWLVRVVLGSAKAPIYDSPTTDEDTDQTTPEQRMPPGAALRRELGQ